MSYMKSRNLVREAYVVYPKRVAYAADVCAAVARVELQHDVRGRFVGVGPTNFLYLNHFALGVFGVFGVIASGECHA